MRPTGALASLLALGIAGCLNATVNGGLPAPSVSPTQGTLDPSPTTPPRPTPSPDAGLPGQSPGPTATPTGQATKDPVPSGEPWVSPTMTPSFLPTEEPPSTVRGHVTVADVARPGALVRLLAADQVFEAVSDADGNYVLYGVPAGTWVMVVRVAGAENLTRLVTVRE
ncbi:MAG: hypothetical protein VKP57_09105 [Candidatus Sericytochromatia bacterium]|nr:hypothetical protein [Candidatus Sericytochromatia bacterium]